MTIPKTEFYFLRHGQTDFNVKQICYGDIDAPLNEAGRFQASSIQPLLKMLPVTTICTSPLLRAKETALIAFQEHPARFQVIPNLLECALDVWHGLTRQDLDHSEETLVNVEEFTLSSAKAVSDALAHPGPIAIVAHGGIYWALRQHLVGEGEHLENCNLVRFFHNPQKGWQTERMLGPGV